MDSLRALYGREKEKGGEKEGKRIGPIASHQLDFQ
jgi:hypothetical protein